MRPVPASEDDSPAISDQRGNGTDHGPGVFELLGDGTPLSVANQGVAPHGDDDPAVHYAVPPTPSRRPRLRMPSVKHSSGARAIPAPICPMPGRRCAIPVLITGRMPVSITRRASMAVGVPR